jgi:hypothetical protein
MTTRWINSTNCIAVQEVKAGTAAVTVAGTFNKVLSSQIAATVTLALFALVPCAA